MATTPTTGSGRIWGIRPDALIKLDDHFGLSRGMVGFERLYKDGNLAIVHGCGYENPNFSHLYVHGVLAYGGAE